MSGHVFVVHGDITRLACDAWLLPGGVEGVPGETWQGSVANEPAEAVPEDFGRSGRRVVRWRPLAPGAPAPYLTDVGGSRGTPITWYLDAVREFVDRASRDLQNAEPRNGRSRPLVALPLVGTGQGGKRREAGAVARELMPVLYEMAGRTELDVALVMIEGAAYSAAQAERAARWGNLAFKDLEPELMEVARRLSRRAARGQLVLFVGAGASRAAGLPSWEGLLAELAEERAGLAPAERSAFAQLGPLDQANVIEERLAGESLGEIVARFLEDRCSHHALAHALLAALPIAETVTTNYDRLFEMASAGASRPLTVLPYERAKDPGERWLLKMHGCVTHPEDIVLTRDHYLAYRERREALAGIVQALLITRHMLFVGFSLKDDNFHQIIRAVRRAIRHSSGERRPRPFGTSLVVAGNPLAEAIWKDDLRLVSMDRGTSLAEASRLLEIMLDRIAAGAVSATAHLFDPRYANVLSPAEQRLQTALRKLVDGADAEMRETGAWAELEALLSRLGWSKR